MQVKSPIKLQWQRNREARKKGREMGTGMQL
jgi:hypothetical protein